MPRMQIKNNPFVKYGRLHLDYVANLVASNEY